MQFNPNNWLLPLTIGLLIPYLFILFYFQVDYPVNNDDLIIEVADFSDVLDGEYSILEYLFKPKNHPNIIHRMCTVATYYLHGRIIFSTVRVLAHLLFIAFALFLIWYYRKNNLAYILPVLLFVPLGQSILWGAAATTYAFPLIFTFLLFIVIPEINNMAKLAAGLVLLPLLTFSFSNSIIGLFLLLIYTLFGLFTRRINKVYGRIIALALITCGIWFYSIPSSEAVATPTFNLKVLEFPLALSGSLGKYTHFFPELSSTLFCILILLAIAIKWKEIKKMDLDDLALLLIIFLVAISGLAIGIMRCSRELFCTPTANRYEVMGVFSLICAGLLIGKYYSKAWILGIIILILSVFKYEKNVAYVKNHMNELKHYSTRAYFTGKIKTRGIHAGKTTENSKIMKAAIDRNLIQLKSYVYPIQHVNADVNCDDLEPIDPRITSYGNRHGCTFVGGLIPTHTTEEIYISTKNGCSPIRTIHQSGNRRQFFTVVEKTKQKDLRFYTSTIK